MSIQHRRRAVMERIQNAAKGGKRKSAPAEYARSSELPPVDHERAPASSRDAAPVAPAVKAAPKKKAKRARKG